MVSKAASEPLSKMEATQLRDYELVLVISPEVTDEELEAKIENITLFITEAGSSISSVEPWGKRRLAYPIQHFTEGIYVLIKLKFKPEWCRQLDARLQISEEILRHLLVKVGS